jgi:hypothetical protein
VGPQRHRHVPRADPHPRNRPCANARRSPADEITITTAPKSAHRILVNYRGLAPAGTLGPIRSPESATCHRNKHGPLDLVSGAAKAIPHTCVRMTMGASR